MIMGGTKAMVQMKRSRRVGPCGIGALTAVVLLNYARDLCTLKGFTQLCTRRMCLALNGSDGQHAMTNSILLFCHAILSCAVPFLQMH